MQLKAKSSVLSKDEKRAEMERRREERRQVHMCKNNKTSLVLIYHCNCIANGRTSRKEEGWHRSQKDIENACSK